MEGQELHGPISDRLRDEMRVKNRKTQDDKNLNAKDRKLANLQSNGTGRRGKTR